MKTESFFLTDHQGGEGPCLTVVDGDSARKTVRLLIDSKLCHLDRESALDLATALAVAAEEAK